MTEYSTDKALNYVAAGTKLREGVCVVCMRAKGFGGFPLSGKF